MATTSAKAKGDALEEAVRAIEEAILRLFPGYSESTFAIECKKIIVSNGGRHEIDIYVTATLGPGYDSIFIFECKNWQAKVGKNEIIVFSEKIKATNAQKGFFVATHFTEDARAQAGLDSRVELLTANVLDPSLIMMPGRFHGIQVGHCNANLEMQFKKDRAGRITRGKFPIDTAKSVLVVAGLTTDAKEFCERLITEFKDARVNRFPSATADEGNHALDFDGIREFADNKVTLDGVAIRRIAVKGVVDIKVCKAVVVSAFEISTRGRHITVQVPMPFGEIRASFVQLGRHPST